ncbi:hypothetical protein LSTR_LSTR009227 [Laodelphax striatellus]|uniref:DDE Tnp4 domain-containing protein n=1 Tax=Laodelphax striatellus TaxID=195883 RepID=A0A482XDM1_LAOST|nr:hypothetical protein LSTR_LSTR009227 [Laodelphax striatellus]
MAARELPEPTEEMWKRNAEQFGSTWQFPNCLSAIDGKHVEIQAPQNSGSLYYNYKKTFSIVLLALVDANYKFVIIDVGGYGKSSDGGLLTKLILGKRLDEGTLNIPAPRQLPNSVDAYPYVIIGDEAFPLKTNLLRPYPGSSARDDERKKIYNYRLSRALAGRRNAFGIMTQKFRIFYGRIHVNPENADKIVMAACFLHNYLRDENIPKDNLKMRQKVVY